MTPRFDMPILRQLPCDTDRPLWRRLLWWREPVVYELVRPFEFAGRVGNRWFHLWLPAGFRSDLASTPRLSWLVGYRPDGMMSIPGLFHDFYYRHGAALVRVAVEYSPGCWARPIGDGSRAWGDRLFRDLARDITGLRLPAWVAYIALRLFGRLAWRANEKYRRAYAATENYQLQGDYDDGT